MINLVEWVNSFYKENQTIKFPLDIEGVIRLYGVTHIIKIPPNLYREEGGSTVGSIIFASDHWGLERWRFTLGHEFGHFLGEVNENLCDQFAADLLCPIPILNDKIKQIIKSPLSLLEELSLVLSHFQQLLCLFGVSIDTLAIKIARSRYYPISLYVCKGEQVLYNISSSSFSSKITITNNRINPSIPHYGSKSLDLLNIYFYKVRIEGSPATLIKCLFKRNKKRLFWFLPSLNDS